MIIIYIYYNNHNHFDFDLWSFFKMRKVILNFILKRKKYKHMWETSKNNCKKGGGLSIYNYFINIKYIIIKNGMYYNISIKFYDYLASFWKGGFQRVKMVIKRVPILKRYLRNNCKGLSFSHRWVGERSDVARLGNGIDIHTYIHYIMKLMWWTTWYHRL